MKTQEAIDSVDLRHLQPQQVTRIRKILTKYSIVIAKSDFDVPINNAVQGTIDLNDSLLKNCYQCKHQPLPCHMIKESEILLDKLIRAGIVVECDDWSPIVSTILIQSKGQGRWRLLCDSRALNSLTYRLPCAFTSINEMFSHLHNKRAVSLFDPVVLPAWIEAGTYTPDKIHIQDEELRHDKMWSRPKKLPSIFE